MAIEALALFVALASAALTTVILVRVSRFDPAAQRQGIDASLSSSVQSISSFCIQESDHS